MIKKEKGNAIKAVNLLTMIKKQYIYNNTSLILYMDIEQTQKNQEHETWIMEMMSIKGYKEDFLAATTQRNQNIVLMNFLRSCTLQEKKQFFNKDYRNCEIVSKFSSDLDLNAKNNFVTKHDYFSSTPAKKLIQTRNIHDIHINILNSSFCLKGTFATGLIRISKSEIVDATIFMLSILKNTNTLNEFFHMNQYEDYASPKVIDKTIIGKALRSDNVIKLFDALCTHYTTQEVYALLSATVFLEFEENLGIFENERKTKYKTIRKMRHYIEYIIKLFPFDDDKYIEQFLSHMYFSNIWIHYNSDLGYNEYHHDMIVPIYNKENKTLSIKRVSDIKIPNTMTGQDPANYLEYNTIICDMEYVDYMILHSAKYAVLKGYYFYDHKTIIGIMLLYFSYKHIENLNAYNRYAFSQQFNELNFENVKSLLVPNKVSLDVKWNIARNIRYIQQREKAIDIKINTIFNLKHIQDSNYKRWFDVAQEMAKELY